MTHRTWVEISERALAHNIKQLRSLTTTGARFCAIVKANAYGHDLKTVARIAGREGVDAFGVDTVADALFLREMFPAALIIVLGYTLRENLTDAVKAGLHVTAYDLEALRELEAIAAKHATEAFVHLKIETGTGRQGVFLRDLDALLDELTHSPHVTLAGVSTHFANLEDTQEMQYAQGQLLLLQEAVKQIQGRGLAPLYIHCACSAAIILCPPTHQTLVRGGIAMYGLWPSEAVEASAIRERVACELRPVLTWKSRIAQVKMFPAGSAIGYGLSERLKRDSRIAVVPVGYWDGYDRHLSSVGETLVNGTRCRVVGRVCMNMMMIDVSAVPNPVPEQEVILLGSAGRDAVSAGQIAKKLSTIAYEVVTRINPLLPRVVV